MFSKTVSVTLYETKVSLDTGVVMAVLLCVRHVAGAAQGHVTRGRVTRVQPRGQEVVVWQRGQQLGQPLPRGDLPGLMTVLLAESPGQVHILPHVILSIISPLLLTFVFHERCELHLESEEHKRFCDGDHVFSVLCSLCVVFMSTEHQVQ